MDSCFFCIIFPAPRRAAGTTTRPRLIYQVTRPSVSLPHRPCRSICRRGDSEEHRITQIYKNGDSFHALLLKLQALSYQTIV